VGYISAVGQFGDYLIAEVVTVPRN